jgi:phosphoribosylformylglycinamidine cyclo-ligase
MDNESYATAGVHLEAAQNITETIKALASPTLGSEVVSGVGFFGAMYKLQDYKAPIIVSSTDSVGTKVKIANLMNRYDTIGIDLVNHCVNDIFTCGARPLFFLDYIAMSTLEEKKVTGLVKGVADACMNTGCALIGGETAELPGVYPEGEFDLVGFIVGAMEKENIIDSSTIQPDDILLGIGSSGIHTNGYSLIRKVFDLDNDPTPLNTVYPELSRSLGEELLEPHRCYYPLLEPVLPLIKGMAHITGGGLIENVPRVLPKNLGASFDTSKWKNLPIFELIERIGNIERQEMFRVFNMGLGMVLVSSPENVEPIMKLVPEATVVGSVIPKNEIIISRI